MARTSAGTGTGTVVFFRSAKERTSARKGICKFYFLHIFFNKPLDLDVDVPIPRRANKLHDHDGTNKRESPSKSRRKWTRISNRRGRELCAARKAIRSRKYTG